MPEPSHRTYHYPRRARWSWAGALIISLSVSFAAVALQFSARIDAVERGQLLLFAAVFVALAAHAYDALRTVSRTVELHHDGIAGAEGVVPWERVRSIAIQPLLRRVDVFDAAGRRVLRLRPELEAFAGVQEYIIEHMQPQVQPPPAGIALLSPSTGALPLVALGLIAVWFGPRQSGVPALLFAGVAAVPVLLHLLRRRSLVLERERLVLRQGWRSVTVPYREITAVRTAVVPGRRRTHAVVLERGGGEPLVIAGFRGGYRAAAAGIQAAWRAGRER